MSRGSHITSQKRSERNFRLIKFMISLLFVVAAFVLGFSLRGNAAVLDRLGMGDNASTKDQNPGLTVSGNTYDSLSARVAEVQGILDQSSLDGYDLDTATANVIGALAATTEDSSVHYYDASHYATYLKDVSASYAGVGLLFAENNGQAYVVDVFSGSEAESAGVQVGDFVVSIDGDRGGNGGWSASEAIKALARDEGSSAVITFRRPSTIDAQGGDEYTVTLTCTDYDEPNVVTELDGSVGYIKLSQISQNADSLVASAVSALADQGAQSYVLDLRDNPGGYLTQAVNVASVFLKSGVVVQIQTKETTSSRQATGTSITDAPVVVLVNGNTAATAETIAAALQDNHRATICGEKTMGKGSVQSVQELSFGGALRYTSAYYKTPLGYSIDGNGITPDVQVVRSADTSVDNQKNLAIETAQSLIRS